MLHDPCINVMIALILVCRTYLDRNAKFFPKVTQVRMNGGANGEKWRIMAKNGE